MYKHTCTCGDKCTLLYLHVSCVCMCIYIYIYIYIHYYTCIMLHAVRRLLRVGPRCRRPSCIQCHVLYKVYPYYIMCINMTCNMIYDISYQLITIILLLLLLLLLVVVYIMISPGPRHRSALNMHIPLCVYITSLCLSIYYHYH